jgi:hypothetical protein
VLAGCGAVWGDYSIVDPENCLEDLTICKTGQHCNHYTQGCEDNVELFPTSMPPASFILPGGQVSTLTFPCNPNNLTTPCSADVRYELGAPQPPEQSAPATLYYTLDGSVPTPGAASTHSGPSPQALGTLLGPTTVTWYADYGPPYNAEAPHTFIAQTTTTVPSDYGSFSHSLTFASSGGPIVIAPEGAHLSFSVTFQAWTSSPGGSCPGCPLQYVLSIPGFGPLACQDNIQTAGPYPGRSFTVYGTLNGPVTAGRYALVAGLTTAPSCDGSTATGPEIGEMFVQDH